MEMQQRRRHQIRAGTRSGSTRGSSKNGVSYGCLPGADVLQEARRHAVHGRKAPRGSSPIRKSNSNSYADTPFTDEITLIEMPRKFSFPNINAYDGTSDPDDHVAQYIQRMLAVALLKESHEATMCYGFSSTLLGPALQWYINLPSRSIASFAILSDKFIEQFTSSRDLEKTSDGLYEILQHRA
uniref:Retrotransposon gag domain-containing protein n=1 Tax=Brassica oleracea var. oleracea TaxID=109376 RepID=A0A0D3D2W1_BRAOL